MLHIAFDRPLLPSSIVRQSFDLRPSGGRPVDPPAVQYDPVAKVVTVRGVAPGAWLENGLPYGLRLLVPEGDADAAGFRALDRSPLEAPVAYAFRTGPPATARAPLEPTPGDAPRTTEDAQIQFCTDVLPLLQSRCGGGACHAGRPATAAMGLALDSPESIARTAVGRVASGANTGPRAGAPRPAGRVFGVDMAIIAPGNPAESWLLYKCLLGGTGEADAPAATRSTCDGRPPLAATRIAPYPLALAPWTVEDRKTLGAYVQGREMPYANVGPGGERRTDLALSGDELQRLRAWIAQGARLENCAPCTP